MKEKDLSYKTLMSRLPKDVIDRLKSTEQSPKFHKEGNVYIHTQMVFEEAKKLDDPCLLVAAIFHDLGKIDTHVVTIDSNGIKKISHYKHEYASLKYIDEYFHLYSDICKDEQKIKEIVKNHMRAHLYLSEQMKRPFKRQQFEKSPYFKDIIAFTGCDDRGRITGT